MAAVFPLGNDPFLPFFHPFLFKIRDLVVFATSLVLLGSPPLAQMLFHLRNPGCCHYSLFFLPKTHCRNSAWIEFHVISLITPFLSRLSETRPASHCFCAPSRGDGLVSLLPAFNYSRMEIKTGAIPLSPSRRRSGCSGNRRPG